MDTIRLDILPSVEMQSEGWVHVLLCRSSITFIVNMMQEFHSTRLVNIHTKKLQNTGERLIERAIPPLLSQVLLTPASLLKLLCLFSQNLLSICKCHLAVCSDAFNHSGARLQNLPAVIAYNFFPPPLSLRHSVNVSCILARVSVLFLCFGSVDVCFSWVCRVLTII